MPNSFQLQFKIQHIIDDLIENWCHKTHRITIESFKRKRTISSYFTSVTGMRKNIFGKQLFQLNIMMTRAFNN